MKRYWAFLAGFALLIAGVAFYGGDSNLFLGAGVLFGFDVYMFSQSDDKC